MFFIANGKVAIMTDTNEILNTLEAGSYFGEICLLTESDARRIATAKALTACDLCTLKKLDFVELMEEYPEVKEVFRSVALIRLSRIGKDSSFFVNEDRGMSVPSVAPTESDFVADPSTYDTSNDFRRGYYLY